ncbi:MAG: hypothetical protein E5W55_10790, partial [Mesorhizobium sp.]
PLSCRTSPPQGGDWLSCRLSPIFNVGKGAPAPELLISPLAGEMPGRAEGGAVPPASQTVSSLPPPH